MTLSQDPTASEPEEQSELIARQYEEEAAMSGGPADPQELVIRIRKIEERLAAIEDYLGGPPSKETLEDRLEKLESSD